MRILVTGGAGFIGSHVVDAYIAAGHHVAVLDNLSHGHRENLNPDAMFYEVDLRDDALAEVFIMEKPDVVCHHAAHIDVRYSVADPKYDAEVNVLGSLNLLECARLSGVRKIIYASSGGAMYGTPQMDRCTEDHPVLPLSPYGATKAFVEKYLFIYKHLYDLDYTVLRYANVYGPRQDPDGEGGVVAIFSSRMLHNEPTIIFGTGEQARDFVYVGDCAQANVRALEGGSGKAYNIGMGKVTTINEIWREIQGITGYQQQVTYGAAKAGEVFSISLDASLAKQELEWQPQISLNEGLTRAVDYFRD